MAELRCDLAVIAGAIPSGSRVLDIGCGDGGLLAALRDRGCEVRGMELDAALVERCVARGLPVMQGDADAELASYPDTAFHYAVLSQTLQTVRRPAHLLHELLRVGQRAFVSFPNFAHWRVRLALLAGGRMPVTAALPVSWHETPNIHCLTVADFRALIGEHGMVAERAWFFADSRESGSLGANWRAEFALFLIARTSSPPA